jgi:putative membrane protein
MAVVVSALPTLNAILNGSCAVLLTAGFLFIRRRNAKAHAVCMVAAFAVSIAFLASYLLYHALHGSSRFPGTGWIRPVYFFILISHTALAIVLVPLALRTLYLAGKNRLAQHVRLARWTLPLWLYVSLTGVVVYWMLYRMRWT